MKADLIERDDDGKAHHRIAYYRHNDGLERYIQMRRALHDVAGATRNPAGKHQAGNENGKRARQPRQEYLGPVPGNLDQMVQGMFVEFHALSNLRTAPRFPDKKSQSNHVDACHHRLCLSKARDEDGAHPSLADALERVPPPGPGSAQDALRARWVERAAL